MDVTITFQLSYCSSQSPPPTASTSVTPTPLPKSLATNISEPLQSRYQLHERSPADGGHEASCPDLRSDEVVNTCPTCSNVITGGTKLCVH